MEGFTRRIIVKSVIQYDDDAIDHIKSQLPVQYSMNYFRTKGQDGRVGYVLQFRD